MAEKFWIQLAHDIDHPSLPFFLAKSGEIMKTYTLGHSQDLSLRNATVFIPMLPPAPFLPFAPSMQFIQLNMWCIPINCVSRITRNEEIIL